jgi:hypothetical protein
LSTPSGCGIEVTRQEIARSLSLFSATDGLSSDPQMKQKAGIISLFAFVVIRAYLQAVTIDEADSAMFYALKEDPAHWAAGSANHILNTILVRFVTTIFGVSAFIIRIPAIAGAFLYFVAIARIAGRLSFDRPQWQFWVLFGLLGTNPLLLDHLVAARGYSLAIGFLTLALSELFEDQDPATVRRVGLYVALAFVANFSFAFAGLSVYGLAVWRSGLRWRIVPSIIPGLTVVLVFGSFALWTWGSGQFVFGAQTWRETLETLAEYTVYRPNPQIINPLLLHIADRVERFILPALIVAWILSLLVHMIRKVRKVEWNPASVTLFALVATSLCHAALRWSWQILLPKERTALWLLVFGLVFLAAASTQDQPQTWKSRLALVTSVTLLFSQLANLRMDHFKEWRFNADSDKAFAAFECVRPLLPPDLDVESTYSQWPYVAAYNFNRVAHRRWNFPILRQEIEKFLDHPPPGRMVYFMNIDETRDFIAAEGLTIIYESKLSRESLAVRVDPETVRLKAACPAWFFDGDR